LQNIFSFLNSKNVLLIAMSVYWVRPGLMHHVKFAPTQKLDTQLVSVLYTKK